MEKNLPNPQDSPAGASSLRLAELLPPGKNSQKTPEKKWNFQPAGSAPAPLIPDQQIQVKLGIFRFFCRGEEKESRIPKFPFDPSKARAANLDLGIRDFFPFFWEQEITSRGFNSRLLTPILKKIWNSQHCLE